MMSFLHAYFAKQSGLTPASSYSVVDHIKQATINWSGGGGGGGVTDHGALTGLTPDDDHPQYHTDARGDARYNTKAEITTALAGKSNTGHTHAQSDVTNLTTALAGKSDTGHTHAQSDITGLTTALTGKRSVAAGNSQVYTRDSGGAETSIPYSAVADGDSIVRRTAAGAVAISDGTATGHAVSKSQLDTGLAAKADTSHSHAVGDIGSGTWSIDRMPPGTIILVDKAKADYGAAGSWPGARPTARTDICIEWLGAEPGPGGLMIAGDKRTIE